MTTSYLSTDPLAGSDPTSTAPTAGTAPMTFGGGPIGGTAPATSTAPSSGTQQFTQDQINQAIQQASQGLDPSDPKAVDQIVAKLNAMGIPASSIPSASEATHKAYVAGNAMSLVSSDNFQPGTYRFQPYVQVPGSGGFDPKTGAPLNPSSTGGGSGSLGALADFTPPSLEDARNSPGYQFALQQGLKGVQNSAASRGTLLTGGTLKALDQYGTGLADNTYGSVFNRALQTNQANYGNWMGILKAGLPQ